MAKGNIKIDSFNIKDNKDNNEKAQEIDPSKVTTDDPSIINANKITLSKIMKDYEKVINAKAALYKDEGSMADMYSMKYTKSIPKIMKILNNIIKISYQNKIAPNDITKGLFD